MSEKLASLRTLNWDLSGYLFKTNVVHSLHLLESKFIRNVVIIEHLDEHHTEPVRQQLSFLSRGWSFINLWKAERNVILDMRSIGKIVKGLRLVHLMLSDESVSVRGLVSGQGVQFVGQSSLHDSCASWEFFYLVLWERSDGFDEFPHCFFTLLLEIYFVIYDSVVKNVRGDLFAEVLRKILIVKLNVLEFLLVPITHISKWKPFSFFILFNFVLEHSVSSFKGCLSKMMRRCTSEVVCYLLLVLNDLLGTLQVSLYRMHVRIIVSASSRVLP